MSNSAKPEAVSSERELSEDELEAVRGGDLSAAHSAKAGASGMTNSNANHSNWNSSTSAGTRSGPE